ncbi:uncharacterized protein LOC127862090 isoform X2 [Dreissena polymorpha]|uniref:uncharacterized protein LOC127862090 isoform X2 n=1 Tax=Dreissena polymorpha TaxID=45954 RepID=UPI002263C776|nr:uncharacterized protein LOC127862090 isoform X2 [Dreissena polymorpha]
MSGSLDDNYHTPEETLLEAASGSDIPIIVRINETYQNEDYDDSGWFEDGLEILVEGVRSIAYARIRVLDVHNEKEAQKAHYDDFVAERQMFLDQVYLMPMNVPLTLKLVTRPGKSTKYTSIAQVIEDMPTKLLVHQDVISIPPGGGQNTLVPANTVLTVKRVFTCSIDTAQYLQCSFQSQHVSFKDTLRVQFSAIGDDTLYTMRYLQMANVFPTVFEFQHPKPDDVVHYVNYEANAALTIAEGPLELLGIEHLNVVIAWKRQHEAKSYSTLAIPESRAKTLMVQTRHFDDKFIKNNYIQRKFTACTHLDFVSDKLYLIPQDPPNAVCLKSPNLFFYDPKACRLRVAKDGITFNPSTDEESYDSDYTEIAPPIPERVPITCPQASEISKKKIGLFHNVHMEIKSLFKKRFKSLRRKRRGEQMREPGGYLSNPMYRRSKSMPDNRLDDSDNNATGNERRKKYSTMGYRRPPAPPPESADSQKITISTKSVLSTSSISNSKSPTQPCSTPTTSAPSTLGSLASTRREMRPLPEIVSTHSDEDSDEYIIPCPSVPPRHCLSAPSSPAPHRPAPPIPSDNSHGDHLIVSSAHISAETPSASNQSEHAREKQGYATISQKDMQSILGHGRTCKDFNNLSVIELYHLLIHCNLHDIANICYEHLFDGQFFADVDVQELLQDQTVQCL